MKPLNFVLNKYDDNKINNIWLVIHSTIDY